VAVHEHGHFEFGADAVDAGDENRIAHLGKTGAEEAPEAADFAEDFRAVGRFDEGGQAGFDFVSEINVNSGAGVGFQAVTHGWVSRGWKGCVEAVRKVDAGHAERIFFPEARSRARSIAGGYVTSERHRPRKKGLRPEG
jgi:hypothetical protein